MAWREPGAGDLDRRITVRRCMDVPAADMGLDSVFSEPKRRWARIEPVGSATYAAGVQTDSKVTHRITLRWLVGITDAHEVLHGKTLYRIRRSSDMNGTHRFTLLEVEELGQVQSGGSIYG